MLRDRSVIGTIGTASGEMYSSRVFRHLEFLLGELSLRLEDFDLFAVAAGPGSFTGLRVGLAAVKGWAEVFGKPIAAVSTLEAVAAQSRSRANTVVAVMDARRNELYWGIYRREESVEEARFVLQGEERAGPREEFWRTISRVETSEDLSIATTAPELISAALPEMALADERAPRIEIQQVSSFLAPEIGQLGWIQARNGKLADALTLDANYIRRSDAELHSKGSAAS